MTPPRRPEGTPPYVSGKSAYRGYFASACALANSKYSSSLALMASACAALTGRTTLPGTPMTRLPAGTCMFSGTSAPAAIRQPSPDDRAVQNRRVHPNQAAVAHRAAVHNGPVPDGRSAPHRYIQPGAGVHHGVVLHVGVFPNGDAPVSARSTAPYQTLLFFSSRTLPASVAFSATNAAPLSAGAWWFIVMKAILLHLRSFRAFPHVVGVGVLDDPGRSRPPSGSAASTAHPYEFIITRPNKIANPLPNVLQYSRNHKGVVLWQSK